ncbi:MAG: beta-lactamase family protein [Bacteroidetes bacterium]|nr:beta-lactamase family protein [Bacteroidota bacterium]
MKKLFSLIPIVALYCNLLALLIISFPGKASGYQPVNLQFDTALINKEIAELTRKYDIPGIALAIITKDSIWIGTHGYADIISKDQVSEKTIFRLGSISKTFLAIAIMQLVEEGKINLHDPVQNILPEIEMNNKWGKKYPVRIIHLLEHTSSIDDVHFNEGYNTTSKQELPLNEVFSINPRSRYVRWKPGEICSYSNDAYSLLALIIERTTGQKFEDYIQKHILDKIGTVSTTYLRNDKNNNLFAQGYTNDGHPLDFVPVLMRPSGGLNSNVWDLASFVQMLLDKGSYNNNLLIDSSTLIRMLFPSSSIPAKEGFKPGYGSGFGSYYIDGHKLYGHGGGIPDFNSIFLFDPDLEVGIVVLINKNSDYFWKVVRKVVSLIQLENSTQKKALEYPKNRLVLDDITGYYSQANFGINLDRFPNYFLSGKTLFFENDTLFSKEFQSEKKAIIHVEGNAYKRINENYELLYFFKNSDGEMMLTVSGKDFYKKDAAWKPIFDRLFLLFSIFIILSFVLFTFYWPVKRVILILWKKERQKISFLSRLIPLAAIISLLVCLISLSVWFGDYNNAGIVSFASVSIFVFSLFFSLFSIIGFWICSFRKSTKIKNKLEKVYLIIVSSTLVALSIFLYNYEIIGLMLWAY